MDQFIINVICSIILLIPVILTVLIIRNIDKKYPATGTETDWHQMCR